MSDPPEVNWGDDPRTKRVLAENQRLREYAQLVETAIEAEECNGKTHDHWTAITLNSSWFKKARALLEERER